jgi:hypothetical protein
MKKNEDCNYVDYYNFANELENENKLNCNYDNKYDYKLNIVLLFLIILKKINLKII